MKMVTSASLKLLPPRRPSNANQRRPDQQNPSQNRGGERPSFESFQKILIRTAMEKSVWMRRQKE